MPSVSKREAQERVLAFVASGDSVAGAARRVGRAARTVRQWCETEREFRRRLDAARLSAGGSLSHMGFVDFRRSFFGHGTPPHHYRIVEAVERAAPDSVSVVLAFPEAAKTTLLVDFICWKLGAVDPNFRVAVISEGQDLSRKMVNQVASRMTDRELFAAYIDAYGPFRSPGRSTQKPWNADFLSVLKASHDEKEPSLEARGAGSTLYGGRYDLMALDDIQSDRNLGQTGQLLRYVRQTVLTRPAKGRGFTVAVGSRVGDGDIYERMIDEGMVDRLITVPALSEPVSRDEHFSVVGGRVVVNPDCPAVPTWDYWSLAELASRRRKVGEEVWARTYMQQQWVSAGATFSDEMVEGAKDRERRFGERNVGTDVVCSVDPGLDSGVCAFVAVATAPQKLYVLDVLERTGMFRNEDILGVIAEWSARFRPSRWVIEQNNFQRGLARDARLADLATRFRFDVIPHQTSRNKSDPVLGVAMMASAFCDGEISIPYADDESIGRMGMLIDELRAWRPRKLGVQLKQDLVMALWFCWLQWEQMRQEVSRAQLKHRPGWMRRAGSGRPYHTPV